MGVLYELVMQRTFKERVLKKAMERKERAKIIGTHRDITKYWSIENRLKEDLLDINNKINQSSSKGAY